MDHVAPPPATAHNRRWPIMTLAGHRASPPSRKLFLHGPRKPRVTFPPNIRFRWTSRTVVRNAWQVDGNTPPCDCSACVFTPRAFGRSRKTSVWSTLLTGRDGSGRVGSRVRVREIKHHVIEKQWVRIYSPHFFISKDRFAHQEMKKFGY